MFCYKSTIMETMLVLTKELKFDGGKAGRARLECIEGVRKLGWLCDDGKAFIEMNELR